MLPEKPADDTEPDLLARRGRIRESRRLVSRGHDLADQRAIGGLKLAVVAALIGKIERLMGPDRLSESGGRGRAVHTFRNAFPPAAGSAPPRLALLCAPPKSRSHRPPPNGN